MALFKVSKSQSAPLEIFIGDRVEGVSDRYSALKAEFYIKIGSRYFPKKGFIGCPNATLTWALKEARLIENQSYYEREMPIYESKITIIIRMVDDTTLEIAFSESGKIVFRHKEKYVEILKKLLSAAIKSQRTLAEYEISTMAEVAINNEIRLMEKHIKYISNYGET